MKLKEFVPRGGTCPKFYYVDPPLVSHAQKTFYREVNIQFFCSWIRNYVSPCFDTRSIWSHIFLNSAQQEGLSVPRPTIHLSKGASQVYKFEQVWEGPV